MAHQPIDLLSERSLDEVAGGGRGVIDCEGYAYLAHSVAGLVQNLTKTAQAAAAGPA